MGLIKKIYKAEAERFKRETSNLKRDIADYKSRMRREFAELKEEQANKPSFKEMMREAKAEMAEQPSLKETLQADKEKRRRKEAAYNPSTFTRIITAASIAFTTIIAILLIPTIVGIPIAALIFGMNVWAWRKYVTKKPTEPAGNQEEIEALHKRIEELERGNSVGK